MGVPALFKWLNNKYPRIISSVIEDDAIDENGSSADGGKLPDLLHPNPNGFEVDNLYLDMNGIIHPCCHPEDEDAPADEEAMFNAIFAYIERLFAMARPRHLLYMAVDGVAPRAKMNQQRSRRFRAAQEAQEQLEASKIFRNALRSNGAEVIPEPDADKGDGLPTPGSFDSNCITPGTAFMANLSTALRRFITEKISTQSSWSCIQIILSDASVPGEGEHKIMDFIRQQQAAPGYPPSMTHAMYGLDADLIMLALATHEPNFFVLREDVFGEQSDKRRNNNCYRCGAAGHHASGCTSAEISLKRMRTTSPHQRKPFIWLSVAILREYLHYEFTWKRSPRVGDFNFEALIDDWIFLIFFVGNDFLPHLPSLSIHEGAIDLLLDLYKQTILPVSMSSSLQKPVPTSSRGLLEDDSSIMLTHRGEVNVARVIELLAHLGKLEDKIFALRKARYERFESPKKTDSSLHNATSTGGSVTDKNLATPEVGLTSPNPVVTRRSRIAGSVSLEPTALKAQFFDPNKPVAAPQKRKNFDDNNMSNPEPTLEDKSKIPNSEHAAIDVGPLQHPTCEPLNPDAAQKAPDEIHLWEAGAKEKYYFDKLGFAPEDTESRAAMVRAYVEGLAWVMAYYYKGCVSWTWFYPFHYAPFASDFHLLARDNASISFAKGSPFRPFEQLLGVLPEASSSLLPLSFAKLMRNVDSPIIDFYPTTFKIDLNGKKHSWKGVALLPFIDQSRLLTAACSISENMLSEEEQKRNRFGTDLYFVGGKSQTHEYIRQNFESAMSLSLMLNPQGVEGKISTTGVEGKISTTGVVHDDKASVALVPHEFIFENPYPERPLSFAPALLPGAAIPPRTISIDDFRRAKFSRQTLRSTYPASLLHHHHHHSMHREYDEKLEANNAAAVSNIKGFNAESWQQTHGLPQVHPQSQAYPQYQYDPQRPSYQQHAYHQQAYHQQAYHQQYGSHNSGPRDARFQNRSHHRDQPPSQAYHSRDSPQQYANANSGAYPSYGAHHSQSIPAQRPCEYPMFPPQNRYAPADQDSHLYGERYSYPQYPSPHGQINPYVQYLSNMASGPAAPATHIPYPDYGATRQNHGHGKERKIKVIPVISILQKEIIFLCLRAISYVSAPGVPGSTWLEASLPLSKLRQEWRWTRTAHMRGQLPLIGGFSCKLSYHGGGDAHRDRVQLAGDFVTVSAPLELVTTETTVLHVSFVFVTTRGGSCIDDTTGVATVM
ncbi:5'-3' exoribonuclease 2 [Mitosporidium daphniae]